MINLTLTQKHISIGAKMVDYAGFNMPVQYEGVIAEHLAVRNNVGVFDVSHMGEIFISGEEAKDFLQFITSNDVKKLLPGKVQYSCLPNNDGGIVDDILVYMFDTNSYMLVVNASNIAKDLKWLSDNNSFSDFGFTLGFGINNGSTLPVGMCARLDGQEGGIDRAV